MVAGIGSQASWKGSKVGTRKFARHHEHPLLKLVSGHKIFHIGTPVVACVTMEQDGRGQAFYLGSIPHLSRAVPSRVARERREHGANT
jgi:hypothetical protein